MTVTETPAETTASGPAEGGKRHYDVNLPFVRIQVRPPELHLPRVSRHDVGHAVDVARTFLPPAERLAYYGGLGALVVLGLIDWPVAAAIGAGTMIAQRTRSQEQRWSPLRGAPPAGRTVAPTAPAAKRASKAGETKETKAETKAPKATAGRTRTTGR